LFVGVDDTGVQGSLVFQNEWVAFLPFYP
jgi:hypothetical protein